MSKPFNVSAAAYEDWMRASLGADFVEADLAAKHRKMRKDPFTFLRATYWRWAEGILEVCPQLTGAPRLAAIGDTHLENFGTWRDVEGRLVWGANDFDEAAIMPYALDLVRLAASALLAGDEGTDAADLCQAILDGYAAGIGAPDPFVLDRDHRWLRRELILSEDERADFWIKYDQDGSDIPDRFAQRLRSALPAGTTNCRFFPRSAGTGSLGRPRFVVLGEWRGGPVLREAKAILSSAWNLAHEPGDLSIKAGLISAGRGRSPDPHFEVAGAIVLRRISPNSRKIEVKDDPRALLSRRMLTAMGREIGNCHSLDPALAGMIEDDLRARGPGWLEAAAKDAAAWVAGEQGELEHA